MSAADLMAVLADGYLRYDFSNPKSVGNDRLVFSKGHASVLLYSIYRAAGVISEDEMLRYRTLASPLEGHPTPLLPWVDVATGSLGQGLPFGVGMALAAKYLERLDDSRLGAVRGQRAGRGLDLGGTSSTHPTSSSTTSRRSST
jgi:transketolase